MVYFKLIMGILLIVTYTWILMRRTRKSGFVKSIFDFDIIIGVVAGLYLIFTSVYDMTGQ